MRVQTHQGNAPAIIRLKRASPDSAGSKEPVANPYCIKDIKTTRSHHRSTDPPKGTSCDMTAVQMKMSIPGTGPAEVSFSSTKSWTNCLFVKYSNSVCMAK